jgi:outer membrane protein, heavy metal efflux system
LKTLPINLAIGLALTLLVSTHRANAAEPPKSVKLSELLNLARSANLQLEVSKKDKEIAIAGVTTAKAFPNPDVELTPGQFRNRSGTPLNGSNSGLSLGLSLGLSVAQPIEFSGLREARQNLAESRVSLAGALTETTAANITDGVRKKAIDMLRAQDELAATVEDLQLTQQILDRVRVRVSVGEAPRFDLLRAEAEVAVAQKNLTSAQIRVRQARIDLKQAVGSQLPSYLTSDFTIEIDGNLSKKLDASDYQLMRLTVSEENPEIAVGIRDVERFTRQIELEKKLVLPQVTVRLQHERDPEIIQNKLGVQLTVPFNNRRQGPIAEAVAGSEKAKVALQAKRFELETNFDSAWEAYISAQRQVMSLEGGILSGSQRVLDVAQAAYRLGERGILEFLDAQRQFRLVRNDLIAARYGLLNARTQLERLTGK